MKRAFLYILLYLVIGLPLSFSNEIRFIKNDGQWEQPFLFKANLGNGALFIEKGAFTYNFFNLEAYHSHHSGTAKTSTSPNSQTSHAFKINFLGSNPLTEVTSENPFTEYYNYFVGKNENNWKSNIKAYQTINYNELYPHIDLSLYSFGNNLKYDVIIRPGGNVKNVKLLYEGTDNLTIDETGNLIITTSINEITEQKPYAYQTINGKRIEVPCRFELKGSKVSFKILAPYNKDLPLIIDPILVFASYSGSTADNFGMTATYGFDGSLFAGGLAFNIGYPTTLGAFDTIFNGTPGPQITDVVISRYDSSGTNLIYSTYLGGLQTETVHSLIANEDDELFLYGVTGSNDFPVTTNAYDTTFNGGSLLLFQSNGTRFNSGTDIYIAKLNGAGTSLLGSTFIGGSLNDGVNHSNVVIGGSPNYDSLQNNYGDQFRGEIILDNDNNCYISSSTRSSDFPIVNGFDNTLGGLQDGVVFKFNADLSTLIWSSYIGGNNMDAGYSIKLDTNNIVYVSGGTVSSLDFPTTAGTIQPSYQGGKADGFIAKIDSNGSSILAATYLGTNDYDQCYFLDIDRFGSVYTVGQTRGPFPVTNAAYSNPNSGQFIARMDNDLTTIEYSTVFGNGNVNSFFSPSAFLVDRCQNVYVSGWGGSILGGGTALTGMPVSTDAVQTSPGDGFNFYLFVLERAAQSLLYGTYYGGNQSQEHVDGGTSRFDKDGIVYQSVCAGCGGNDDFPTSVGAWSRVNNSSNCNNGVFKFDFEIVAKARFSVDNFVGCAPLTVTFTNSSNTSESYLWDFGGGDTTSQIFNPVRTYVTPGTYNVSLLIEDSICNIIDTAFQIITVGAPLTITGGTTITTCDTATLSVSSTGGAASFIWSSNNQFSDTLNSNLNDSNFFVSVSDTTMFWVMLTNGACSVIDSFTVNHIGVLINANDTAICLGEPVNLLATNLLNDPLTYAWTPASSIISGANTPNPTVNPDSSTTYTVTAQNASGCIATDTVRVVASGFDPNNIIISADKDSLFAGEGTFLHVLPSSGFTYSWTPTDFLDNPSSDSPFVSPKSTTTYTALLTENSSNCVYSKTITIYLIEVNCDEPDVFIPNAFTPNKDGENDILFVRGKNVKELELKIYDRWGEKVFETTQQISGWDGTYKGEVVEPGVFVYYLKVICIDDQEYFKKGNISVIR